MPHSAMFENMLSKINIQLDDKQYKQFDRFYEMLVEWNKVMNLTGITEYEEVIVKHFVDSLAVNVVPEVHELLMGGCECVDVGTGAGFPGIPLKIAFPQIQIDLLDSLMKRLKFLDAVIDENGLEQVRTIHSRAEEAAQKADYRQKYDLCVSRAVANLSSLSEYCLPYVKINGLFVAMKSGEIEEELEESQNAVKILGGSIVRVDKMVLPDSDISRSFVIIKKVKDTPKKYPRKAGMPTKEPIK